MASTYTVAGIELITQGEQAGAWGNTTNTNWELIEEMVGGVASVALSTTSESLSVTDGASSDARHAAVVFTGSPGGTCTVTVSPNDMQKIYFIINNSDETVSMTQGSGANVSIPAGSKKIVYCDGAGAGAAVVDLTTNLDISGLHLGGTEVTSTAAELNILDGATLDVNELNILDGATLDVNELNILDGVTATTAELNILDGVTATTAELNILDGVTATAAEINALDGITATVTELNYTDGVTSAIQTQLDAKAPLASPALTGTATAVNLTLSGDLTVNGTTTTVNSTNTVVSDALIELANGTTGTPANDAGLVIERGDSNNAFIGFDESADKFIVGTGTFTGASTGDLTITTGTLVANIEGNVTGNLTGDVTGNADTATTLETARTIGGVSFNGSANINLPGVNTTGNQDTSGNAATATKWATGRTISLTGDVTGTSGSFDGSGNLSFATTIAANSVALGTDTTGNYVASITNGSYITGGNGGSEGAGLTLAVDATSANTASKVVARDASGNFSAGTITADLSGNASTATAWATGRTISLTGDVTGTSGSFDGSGNLSFATTIAANSVALGTDTTGNYMSGLSAGTGIGVSHTPAEGSTATVSLSHLGIQSLTDPNADRIMFWDDSAGAMAWLSAGTNITISGTTISATDTNTTYSAGAGLDLSSTTFSIESDLRGDVYYIGRDTNDYYLVNTTTHDWRLDGNLDMRLENDGDLHVDGDVIAYSTTTSDPRLKDNIQKVEGALEKVEKLTGYTFTYKVDGRESAGVMSTEVKEVLPSAVRSTTLPLKSPNGEDDQTEYDVVQYDQLHAVLIEAVKELSAKVKELEAKLG